MKSVFAIVCSSTPGLYNTEFYSTSELAKKRLKEIAKERRHKRGVEVVEETETKFVYILGWEEHRVAFSVAEFPVKEE